MNTGVHVWRAVGPTVAERKGSSTQAESIARWPRERLAAYEAKRQALLFDFSFFFFLTGCNVFQPGTTYKYIYIIYKYTRGAGIFSFRLFRFCFHCICCTAVLLCRAVLSLSYVRVGT